jgi:acetylornithine deacetylase/succinyl-diaminopimelate desuccinylase-like protein
LTPKLYGETGYSTLERTWARPSLDVNGMLAGFTGEGAKTVIPATAMAKISMRLVPNQDPDKIARLF